MELHIVTGKGGVGKTTVAASLALALAGRGRHVLLTEVEGRQGLAQVLDTAPLPYEEIRIAAGRSGGDVFGLAIDPEAAFYEYLDMFYRLGPAARALRKVGAVDFASTVAPGLRDVLLLGKVYEAVGTRRGKRRRYDAVVLDAPPIGRITRFLNVGAEVSGLAKVGPVRAQADAITRLVASDRTVVHMVTLLEELPVQETREAVDELRAAGLRIGALITNAVEPEPLPQRARPSVDDLASILKRVSIPRPKATAAALLDEAELQHARSTLQHDQRARLDDVTAARLELPALASGVDLPALYAFAELLEEFVVAQGWRP